MAVTYSSLDGSHAKNLGVIDDHYGSAAYLSGETNEDGYLDVSETWIYQVSGTIGAPGQVSEDPIVNLATVTGQDFEGGDLTPASDTHSTDVRMQIYLPLTVRVP